MNTDIFKVRNYGAVGDGNHNDQPAIMLAINAAIQNRQGGISGGVVLFPIGKYKIDDPITVEEANNITLSGTTGIGTVVIPSFSSGACIKFINVTDYSIKNIELQGGSSNELVGIYCRVGAFKGFIDTFKIYNCKTAIQVDTNINDLTISNGIIASEIDDSCGIRISADSDPVNEWEQRIDIIQLRSITINQNGRGTGVYAGQGLNTLRMDNVGLINNNYGFVASSSTTLPGPWFIFANDVEIDFSTAQNIYLDKGIQFVGCNLYLQGAAGGCLGVNPGFTEVAITTSRILPNPGQYAIHSQADKVTVSTCILYGPIIGDITQAGNVLP